MSSMCKGTPCPPPGPPPSPPNAQPAHHSTQQRERDGGGGGQVGGGERDQQHCRTMPAQNAESVLPPLPDAMPPCHALSFTLPITHMIELDEGRDTYATYHDNGPPSSITTYMFSNTTKTHESELRRRRRRRCLTPVFSFPPSLPHPTKIHILHTHKNVRRCSRKARQKGMAMACMHGTKRKAESKANGYAYARNKICCFG